MDKKVETVRGVDTSLLLSRNQRIVSCRVKPYNEKEVARFSRLCKIVIKLFFIEAMALRVVCNTHLPDCVNHLIN